MKCAFCKKKGVTHSISDLEMDDVYKICTDCLEVLINVRSLIKSVLFTAWDRDDNIDLVQFGDSPTLAQLEDYRDPNTSGVIT